MVSFCSSLACWCFSGVCSSSGFLKMFLLYVLDQVQLTWLTHGKTGSLQTRKLLTTRLSPAQNKTKKHKKQHTLDSKKTRKSSLPGQKKIFEENAQKAQQKAHYQGEHPQKTHRKKHNILIRSKLLALQARHLRKVEDQILRRGVLSAAPSGMNPKSLGYGLTIKSWGYEVCSSCQRL